MRSRAASSIYDYCVRRLRYSGSSACRRIRAARCIREYPDVLVLLESGELDLGSVYLIEPVLSEENAAALLARVQGKSYRGVLEVLLGEFLERHSPEARQRRREARRAAAEQSTSAGGKFSTAGAGGSKQARARLRSRHVPGEVRDEVFIRDGAR